jgi:hypothetical protein
MDGENLVENRLKLSFSYKSQCIREPHIHTLSHNNKRQSGTSLLMLPDLLLITAAAQLSSV